MAKLPAELLWLMVFSIFSDHPPSSTIAECLSVHQCQPCSHSPLPHLPATLTLPKLCPFILFLHPHLHTVLPVCPPSPPALTATHFVCLDSTLPLLTLSTSFLSYILVLRPFPAPSWAISGPWLSSLWLQITCVIWASVFAMCDPEGKAWESGGAVQGCAHSAGHSREG